jgi:hypothetical protein
MTVPSSDVSSASDEASMSTYADAGEAIRTAATAAAKNEMLLRMCFLQIRDQGGAMPL